MTYPTSIYVAIGSLSTSQVEWMVYVLLLGRRMEASHNRINYTYLYVCRYQGDQILVTSRFSSLLYTVILNNSFIRAPFSITKVLYSIFLYSSASPHKSPHQIDGVTVDCCTNSKFCLSKCLRSDFYRNMTRVSKQNHEKKMSSPVCCT